MVFGAARSARSACDSSHSRKAGARARTLRLRDRVFLWRDLSVDRFVDTYRANLGQMNSAFAQLDPDQSDALSRAVADIALRHNRATDGTIATAFSYVTVVIAT